MIFLSIFEEYTEYICDKFIEKLGDKGVSVKCASSTRLERLTDPKQAPYILSTKITNLQPQLSTTIGTIEEMNLEALFKLEIRKKDGDVNLPLYCECLVNLLREPMKVTVENEDLINRTKELLGLDLTGATYNVKLDRVSVSTEDNTSAYDQLVVITQYTVSKY
ncbi:hypothetical protein [Psittacicella hinzii]|uniref:Uncharacterized protein n=1 Tax=Psittacicella hinzii TaxID=2028575 RepID=A0A3A1YSW0_9GAMM|nr:hypothetical protein [Psittacicella hinzii]RIY39484.1 hypothetical protein CKF58_02145 [Psittacicella hinzii]